MIELLQDAPGRAACGRSGLPLMAVCPEGHRRSVPWRSLDTHDDDETPLYGRRYKCFVCGRREVTLFALETQAELDAVRSTFRQRDQGTREVRRIVTQPRDPKDRFL